MICSSLIYFTICDDMVQMHVDIYDKLWNINSSIDMFEYLCTNMLHRRSIKLMAQQYKHTHQGKQIISSLADEINMQPFKDIKWIKLLFDHLDAKISIYHGDILSFIIMNDHLNLLKLIFTSRVYNEYHKYKVIYHTSDIISINGGRYGSMSMINYLIDELNIDPKYILHQACIGDRFDIVKYIIDQKRDVKVNSRIIYDTICMNNNADVVEYLIEKANHSFDDYLEYAVEYGNLSVVKILLSKVSKSDPSSLIKVAIEREHDDIAKYLIEHYPDSLNDIFKWIRELLD